MKKKISSPVQILIFLIGLSLLLYPSLSDYWNKFHQSIAIDSYAEAVALMNETEYDLFWSEAKAYNADIVSRENPYVKTDKQSEKYDNLLNISGTGVMGYIEIPSIDCDYPIYHGTNETVLQKAIGHIDWTSLPVGGESTHSVLSGHRGLPSAKLFTNLSEVVVGDLFMIRVLDETLTYEVDQILTVLPDDSGALLIEEGRDYCTLVTCTPYGINTHRLLVRGHRVDNVELSNSIRVTADAVQIEPIIVALLSAVPLLAFWAITLTISEHFTEKNNKMRDKVMHRRENM